MSIDKPWSKPFTASIGQLCGMWNGTVEEPPSDQGNSSISIGSPDLFVYPKLTATVSGYTLEASVYERPLSGISSVVNPLEGDDNVEFLRITVRCHCARELIIRHEGVFDRFKKAIGLEYEPQTGNAGFDRKYFLMAPPGADIGWLKQSGLIGFVDDLEPFTAMKFGPLGVEWAAVIEKKEQLEVDRIRVRAESLLKLAPVVCAT